MYKSLSLLLAVVIISACIVFGHDINVQAQDDIPVTFPDSNLETAIREAINKPEGPIYSTDLESLIRLEAWSMRITDLTGLEYCLNLQELSLGGNNISDISPLASLTNLTTLTLGGNNISDISPLASLTNITKLRLSHNRITDISPLQNLTELTWLYLVGNEITDASPLVKNSGLSEGDEVSLLQDNPLSDKSLSVYIPELRDRGVNIPRAKTLGGFGPGKVIWIPFVAFIAVLVAVLLFLPPQGDRRRGFIKRGLVTGVVLTGLYTLLSTLAMTFDAWWLEDLIFLVWIPGAAIYGTILVVIIIAKVIDKKKV